jgi:hypothetical protein
VKTAAMRDACSPFRHVDLLVAELLQIREEKMGRQRSGSSMILWEKGQQL